MEDLINNNNYTALFHDGDLTNISYPAKDYLIITIESAEVDDDYGFEILINRSSNQTIHGELHCKQITKILINDVPSTIEDFYLKTDCCTILDFEFLDSQTVRFFIWWSSFDKNKIEIYEDIVIQANKFSWKNFN